MNALDKIVAEILSQAGSRADAILRGAEEEAAAIREKASAERERLKKQSADDSERECRDILNRAESADRQARRRALLETRNLVIDEVLAEAKAALAAETGGGFFTTVEQGNIIYDNSMEAVFEAERQALRDIAHEALTAGD